MPPRSRRSRRFCRAVAAARSSASRCAASTASRLAARKARSVLVSSSGRASSTSRPDARRVPAHSAEGSRPSSSHSVAATASRRCTARPATSCSSQPRSRGHSRNSASWATSTEPLDTVSSRARARSSTTVRIDPWGSASSSGQWDAAAGDPCTVAGAGQPQQKRASGRSLVGWEGGIRLLGERGDGAAQTAEGDVGRVGESAALPPLPHLGHCGGEQGEQAGLLARVADEGVGEPVLEGELSHRSRALDGAADLRGRHRSDQHRPVGEQ